MGGTDAWAAYINDRGQVAGWSYTNTAVNATTGLPTQHPFIWEDGHFRDLGTLGGTSAIVGGFGGGVPGGGAINNRGQVAGTSNLSGDANWHPYLWSEGRMTDLGTLGGPNGEAYWINNNGDVVGRADVAGGNAHRAFLWRRGKMLYLGAAPGWPCSTAVGRECSRGNHYRYGHLQQGRGAGHAVARWEDLRFELYWFPAARNSSSGMCSRSMTAEKLLPSESCRTAIFTTSCLCLTKTNRLKAAPR